MTSSQYTYDTTITDILTRFTSDTPLTDVFDQILRGSQPWITSVCADTLMKHNLPMHVLDDMVSVGLEEIFHCLGRLLAGWRPHKPAAKLSTVAYPGMMSALREWIDGYTAAHAAIPRSRRAATRHRRLQALASLWEATYGTTATTPTNIHAFLTWANTRQHTRLTVRDAAPIDPQPLLTHASDSHTRHTWDDEALAITSLTQAARTTIAWADQRSSTHARIARFLLAGYTQGHVTQLAPAPAIMPLLPGVGATRCHHLHQEVVQHFRHELTRALT